MFNIKEKNKTQIFDDFMVRLRHPHLSENAIKGYLLYWERFSKAMQDKQLDDQGRIYCHFTNSEMRDALGVCDKTVLKIKKDLIACGLLRQEYDMGNASRLYVKEIQ